MSDHIFLGASLIAILTAEAHLLAGDVRTWRRGAGDARQLCHRALVSAAAAACALLFALIATEM